MSLPALKVVTPLVLVAAGVFFLVAERLRPYVRGEKAFRDEFWSDLIGYGILQSYLLGLLISALIERVDGATGLSSLRLVSDWPLWSQAAFFIITHDLATYWIHRTQHRVPFLWRFHEAHHSCRHVDWLSGIRSHSGEILIYQTVEYLPVVLLGAAPEIPLIKAMANGVYGMYIHSNLSWRMGALGWILNGPEYHRWHHANDDAAAFDRNFATKLSLWDRLFGTLFDPGERRAVRYGSEDPRFPRGWIAQHLYAFRRRE